MDVRDKKFRMPRRTIRSGRGYTLIELVFAATIIMIISAMAIVQLKAALQIANSDAAMRELVNQLRQAREYSIANRRYIQVAFPVSASGLPQIRLTQMNTLTTSENAGSNVVLSTVTLESPLVYTLVAGMSATTDTPDKFGNASAIEFANVANGPPTGMFFQSDGELVNATYQPINGTVFLGVAGNPSSARAVTVLGTTGRVRGWKSNGKGWYQF